MNPSNRQSLPSDDAGANPYRWAMLAGVWLVYFCFSLTVVSMAPLVVPISRELGLSNTAMGGVLGAWPLVYIAAAVPCGILMDRFGPRRALFAATLLIALSGALRGVAEGHLQMFLAVAVFGLGGPLVSVGAPKIIGLWFTGSDRGLAMGFYVTGNALGGVCALALTNSVFMPLAGGDWRLVLTGYAGLVVVAGLVWLAISSHPESRRMERYLSAQPSHHQLRVFAELLSTPTVRMVMLMAVGCFFFNYSFNNWLPRILLDTGMDAVEAGYWAAIPTAVGVIGALILPRLAIPSRRFAMLLAMILAAAAAPLLIQSAWQAPMAIGLILQGIARGSVITVLLLLLLEDREVGPARIGSAGGLFFSAGEIGGVLGPLTLGYMSDVTGGFAVPLDMLTGVSLGMAVLLFRLRRHERRPD